MNEAEEPFREEAEANRRNLPDALVQCVKALDDKKAMGISLLDVRGKSSVTDFLLICTCTSNPHLKALRRAVEAVVDVRSTKYRGSPDVDVSGWIALDAIDFIVHLFNSEMRDHYKIEYLWRDAPEIDVEALLAGK